MQSNFILKKIEILNVEVDRKLSNELKQSNVYKL